MTTNNNNIAVVQGVVQAVNDGTIARVAAGLFASEFMRHDLADALPNASGPSGVSDFIRSVRRALPDFQMKIIDIFGAGD